MSICECECTAVPGHESNVDECMENISIYNIMLCCFLSQNWIQMLGNIWVFVSPIPFENLPNSIYLSNCNYSCIFLFGNFKHNKYVGKGFVELCNLLYYLHEQYPSLCMHINIVILVCKCKFSQNGYSNKFMFRLSDFILLLNL